VWRVGCLVAGVSLGGTASALAQVPAVGVPKGVLRIETDGLFGAFDEQFRNGSRESYAASLSSPALGSDRIPALADVDARVGRIVGNSSFRLSLGQLTSDAHTDISTAILGASLGLSNRLTVFTRLPLVSQRVQSISRLDPAGADAGVVPPVAQQVTCFQQFDVALSTLGAKLTAGDYDANPTRKALAEATLASATSLREDLFAVLGDPTPSAPFAPIATSAAGTAIATQLVTLQSTLSTELGITGFAAGLVLPAAPLTTAELESFLSADLGYRPGQTQLRFRGDAEAGIAYTLIDRWNLDDHRRSGFRTAVSALIRFPTGVRDRSDRLLDLGSGDGQTDVELNVVTDVGGRRWGARFTGTYVRQLQADVVQRVTGPDQPLVGPERLAAVRWNPGDVFAVGARPFYRVANTLALQAGVDHWRRGADDVSYATAADAIPDVPAAVLATDTKASATSIAAGLTYANLGALRPGGKGLPVEASWLFERVVSSGEGRVPAVQRVRASLRLYFQLF
jgi:hypothetical protein